MAEGLAEVEVKTFGDTLVKVESSGEASQKTRAQGRRVVEKVEKTWRDTGQKRGGEAR